MPTKRKSKKASRKPAAKAKTKRARVKGEPLDRKTHDLLHAALAEAGLGTHRIGRLELLPMAGAPPTAGICHVVRDPVTGAITIQC